MRGAFSLIELIFALVVMGIALLAVPSLLSQTSAHTEQIIKNEAIFQAFRSLNTIMSYRWDENSSIEDRIYILDVATGDSELGRSSTDPLYRRSHFTGDGRRVFYNTPTYPSDHFGFDSDDGSIADDVDDFVDITESITQAIGDYTLNFDLEHQLSFIDDSASYAQQQLSITLPTTSSVQKNIKQIQTIVTSDGKTIIRMQAFVCNIGETFIGKKVAN